jgi:hypothetical protein
MKLLGGVVVRDPQAKRPRLEEFTASYLSELHLTYTSMIMSDTAAIPLGPMPSVVAGPTSTPYIDNSAMSGGAVTSPSVPTSIQPPLQVNQASPTPSSRRKSLQKNLHSCKSWIKSHPILSIAGIIIALTTLFVGYYQARAANKLTSKGNSLAKTALDYTRYQTWCQNSGVS